MLINIVIQMVNLVIHVLNMVIHMVFIMAMNGSCLSLLMVTRNYMVVITYMDTHQLLVINIMTIDYTTVIII